MLSAAVKGTSEVRTRILRITAAVAGFRALLMSAFNCSFYAEPFLTAILCKFCPWLQSFQTVFLLPK